MKLTKDGRKPLTARKPACFVGNSGQVLLLTDVLGRDMYNGMGYVSVFSVPIHAFGIDTDTGAPAL